MDRSSGSGLLMRAPRLSERFHVLYSYGQYLWKLVCCNHVASSNMQLPSRWQRAREAPIGERLDQLQSCARSRLCLCMHLLLGEACTCTTAPTDAQTNRQGEKQRGSTALRQSRWSYLHLSMQVACMLIYLAVLGTASQESKSPSSHFNLLLTIDQLDHSD